MPQATNKFDSKVIDKNLTEYSQESSIHGIKYLTNRNRPLADRIFWIIIVCLSVSCLGYLVVKIGRAWLKNSVMITADTSTPNNVFEIPFPAVTICPTIKFKRDQFNILDLLERLENVNKDIGFFKTDYGKKFTMASQICEKSFEKYVYSILNMAKNYENTVDRGFLDIDWYQTLHNISPSRDEVIESCAMSSWNVHEWWWRSTSKKNCERLFATIITNAGICFTFNTVRDLLRNDSLHTEFSYYDIQKERDGWDPDYGYSKSNVYPYKGIVKGAIIGAEGLKFELVINETDLSPICHATNIGYKIMLHSPTVYPHTYEKYISLDYGKEYKIAVQPKTITTAEDLRSFKPESRNCYFRDERQLKYYTYYNEVNCRLECYANYSTNIWGAAPFSSPRNGTVPNSILTYNNFGWDIPEFIRMNYEHFKVYGTPENIDPNIYNCDCLPECNSIDYEPVILQISNDGLQNFPSITVANNSKIRTSVEIIFNERSYVGGKRIRMYSTETMISDFGGLLGLFMGGSLLSLIELIYFATIRNCFKSKNVNLQC